MRLLHQDGRGLDPDVALALALDAFPRGASRGAGGCTGKDLRVERTLRWCGWNAEDAG